MDSRSQLQEQESASHQLEFSIFSAALSLLSELGKKKQNAFQEKLIELCCAANTDLNKEQAKKLVSEFIDKFKRKSSKIYGNEAFYLRAISTSLNTEKKQRLYLQRDPTFQHLYSRQLLNITSKVINHFVLNKLAILFKTNYFDQVDLFPVEKYLDPEHKSGQINDPVTRYASLLTAINSKSAASEHIIPCPHPDLFAPESGFRLIPKNKMNPRLPLSLKEMGERTPEGVKYDIREKEYLIDATEILGTEELLKLKHNKHASKTPGPICLSSFPVVSSLNPSTQTIMDLINDLHITSVVTIEEKFIAEQIFEGEIKALPSDWLQYGVTVGLVQCPDLHALRLFHNFLVAQYLFSEVLKLLPAINDDKYIDAINDLMKRSFRDSDKEPSIKSKKGLPNLFHEIADQFSGKIDNEDYIHILEQAQAKIWHQSPGQSSDQKDKEHKEHKENQKRALIHCKAGMSRSATALLSMYIISIDIILQWHANDFIKDKNDQSFFGAILKAIIKPGSNPLHDVHHIIQIFSEYYRPIKLIPDQVMTLAQLIHYKRNMLKEAHVLNNHTLEELVNCDHDHSRKLSVSK